MKKIRFVLFLIGCAMIMASCAWPKVFVKTSSGWVTYDRLNHKLEVVWDFSMQTPVDSTGAPYLQNPNDSIAK